MSLNRLEPSSDLQSNQGRGQLQESLDLIAIAIRNVRQELTEVREQEKLVAPVPIEEFPFVDASDFTFEGEPAGTIKVKAYSSGESGWLVCDGGSYNTSVYPSLFAAIGYSFGGAGSNFNVPNMNNRTIRGTNGIPGGTGGADSVTLITANMPAHVHGLNTHTHTSAGHTHDMGNHVHDHSHTHNYNTYLVGGGAAGTAKLAAVDVATVQAFSTVSQSSTNTSGPSTNTTGSTTPGATGGPSVSDTTSTGGGASFSVTNPYVTLAFMIKTGLGASQGARSARVNFGRVNGIFDLEGQSVWGNLSASNLMEVVETGRAPQHVGLVAATVGLGAGNSSVFRMTFMTYVPYNFRRWKTKAIQLWTKLSMAGCPGGSSATFTLRVRNPLSTSGYLTGTSTRTLNVTGGGLIADAAWVDMVIKSTDMLDDWQPGYVLRCELEMSVPNTFTSLDVRFGRLKINW